MLFNYREISSIFLSNRQQQPSLSREREREREGRNPKNLPLIRARWRYRDKGYRLISPFIILPAVHRKNSNFANPFSRAPQPARISMPLPYRALWSYIRYTLYFIAYTPFHPPQQPRPTPVSRIYPLSFFPPPFAPVVCSFSGCMHAVPRGAGYYAVGVASTTLLPPSLSLHLSLHLSVHIFLEHLCSSDARVRTSRAPADVGACAHARAGRAAKEKHFSGALLLSWFRSRT